MLIARDLWVRYGRRDPWVLAGDEIVVERGQVVGLWGPSGCGKSTLAACLAGLLTPQRGEVEVDGRPRTSYGGPRPVQLVLQHPDRAMDPRWRIRDILAEARPDGPEQVLAAGAGDLVSDGWLDRFPHEISGGELQRVNLARALLVQPAYVVADEISSSLDAITQAELWHHLSAQVHDRGIGVLAVSHDRPLLDAVADVVVELEVATDEQCGRVSSVGGLPRYVTDLSPGAHPPLPGADVTGAYVRANE